MQRVVVSVKRYDESEERDLDLPVQVAASKLVELIAGGMEWGPKVVYYEIWVNLLGRVLRHNETLAEAGVWDGAYLVLQPEGYRPSAVVRMPPFPTAVSSGVSTPPPSVSAPIPAGSGGVVINWGGTASEQSVQSDTESSSASFVWKQLD